MAELKVSGSGRVLAIILVGILALVAATIAWIALRTPEVQDGGELPGPLPTWTDRPVAVPTGAPTSSPEAPVSVVDPSNVALALVDLSDEGAGVRASTGSCGGEVPTAEVSGDRGTSWSPVSFGDLTVSQILAVNAVSSSQIDIVARIGPDCSTTLISSFTGGEYWQSYPERVQEALYVEPTTESISYFGVAVPKPCDALIQVAAVSGGIVAACSEQIYFYEPATSAWRSISDIAPVAIAGTDQSESILVATVADAACQGVSVVPVGITEEASAVAEGAVCVGQSAPSLIALSTSSTTSWLWTDQFSATSSDAGATWSEQPGNLG